MVTVFVMGVIVALFVEEVTGNTPGGVIVPGFLALSWSEPARLAATVLTALAVLGIVQLLRPHFFLYGRRRFAYCVVTGVVLKQLLLMILPAMKLLSWGLLVIGLIIPGLIAETCLRQGVLRTFAAMIIAVVLTRLVAVAVLGWMP